MANSPNRRPTQSVSLPFDRKIVKELNKLLGKKPRQLTDYFAIGIQMEKLKLSIAEAPGGRHGSNWRKKLAKKLHLSESTLNRCLQFRQSYGRRDVVQLKRSKFPWAHVSITFGIRDKLQRNQLLKKAQDEGWNVRELQREIQRINGRRRGGGRKRKEPKSRGLLADVVELGRLSDLWNGYYEKVGEPSLDAGARGIDEHIDVDVLQKQLTHSLAQLKTLQKVARKATGSITTLQALLSKKRSV